MWTDKAENGDTEAQFKLARLYKVGFGKIDRNYEEAFKWFTLAAENGHIEAQFNLGLMYEYGYGVTENYKKALEWYKLAAKQGHAEAQKALIAKNDHSGNN